MRTRIITAVVYVLAVIGLCAAKWLIPEGYGALLFDAVFIAISVIGAYELMRAAKVVSFLHKTATITFCALAVPLYVLMYMLTGEGWIGLIDAMAVGAVIICVLFVADNARSDFKSTLISLFTLLYVGLLTCLLTAINHLSQNSMFAIILTFMCVPFTDAGAFIFGVSFGRWLPYKLAKNVSPNKTLIGAAGGIIGGILGAVAAYYLFIGLGGEVAFSTALPEIAAVILIGVAASVATQFGDLFESALKRQFGVKDMGKILPGHGGVLDRFDGTLFAGIVILLSFILAA